jgi:hypothetical protein
VKSTHMHVGTIPICSSDQPVFLHAIGLALQFVLRIFASLALDFLLLSDCPMSVETGTVKQ